MTWTAGRPYNKPYTEVGVRKVRCVRCDARAVFQWQACSDGNRWHALCGQCDVALNRLVMHFMGNPNADQVAIEYAKKKGIET